MGSKRTTNKGLPPRMYKKGRAYYHVPAEPPRKWRSLGSDWPIALRLYADIEGTPYPTNDVRFKAIAARYRRDVMPTKAFQTQKDNEKELGRLEAVFADMPIDAIKPHHVRKYLDIRGLKARVRANREKALLSHVFNCAREWGYTDAPNPCAGVKGHKEAGRDRYVTDTEFRAVCELAHFTVQDAMELAYYTGQRVGDVLRLKRADIRQGALWLRQQKTAQPLRITISGKLAEVIERILARPRRASGLSLIQDENGQPLTYTALRSRFDAARRRARVSFQFRDIRAKAATDLDDLPHAQKLLGHKRRATTEGVYLRVKGNEVAPVERDFVEDESGIVEEREQSLSRKPAR